MSVGTRCSVRFSGRPADGFVAHRFCCASATFLGCACTLCWMSCTGCCTGSHVCIYMWPDFLLRRRWTERHRGCWLTCQALLFSSGWIGLERVTCVGCVLRHDMNAWLIDRTPGLSPHTRCECKRECECDRGFFGGRRGLRGLTCGVQAGDLYVCDFAFF